MNIELLIIVTSSRAFSQGKPQSSLFSQHVYLFINSYKICKLWNIDACMFIIFVNANHIASQAWNATQVYAVSTSSQLNIWFEPHINIHTGPEGVTAVGNTCHVHNIFFSKHTYPFFFLNWFDIIIFVYLGLYLVLCVKAVLDLFWWFHVLV